MARELSEPDRRARTRDVVRHGDHVHVGRGARSAAATRTRPDASSTRRTAQPGPPPADRGGPLRRDCPAPWSVPPRGLVAVSLVLTVVAGPLFALHRTRSASDLLDRELYISAVLPGGSR